MSTRTGSRLLSWLLLVAILLGLLATARSFRVGVVLGHTATLFGQWTDLGDLPWDEASTGWLAVANDNKPTVDRSFSGKPLLVNGNVFERGLGTYPLSQITYRLGGQYTLFQSQIGLNDDSVDGRAEVRFMVMLDGILVYNSGPVYRGEAPRRLELFVVGGDELRLVTQTGPDSGPVYPNWVEPRLLRSLMLGEELAARQVRQRIDLQQQARARTRENDRGRIAAVSSGLASLLAAAGVTNGPQASGKLDEGRGLLLLGNNQVAVALGYGGEHHGLLTIWQRRTGQAVLHEASPAVEIGTGERIDLHEDTEPDSFVIRDVVDPAFGQGKELEVSLRSTERRPWRTHLVLGVFDGQPYVLMRMLLTSEDQREVGSPTFRYFQGLTPNVALGEGLQYLTDFSRVRHSTVPDDGLLYREAIGYGKPLYLWSEKDAKGLILSVIDEAKLPSRFSIQVDPGQVQGRLGLSSPRIDVGEHQTAASSPTLYIEPVVSANTARAFGTYRRLMARRYPPLPLPDWMRYQWLSWYVYYMDIRDQDLRSEIDYIADNLGDLGPWHIIVDAGWYVAEGREGADWRNVDRQKFPDGLRRFVDYAHAKGVRVVLYFSAPYLDSRQNKGDWLGLRNIIEQHPDWLVRLGEEGPEEAGERQSFVYDFTNPGLRQYLQDVMEDYFVRYDVDGIKIDGLGNAEGALLTPDKLDGFGLVEKTAAPTMEIYRFIWQNATQYKPEAYIESGWTTPLFANRYAHTFRYGDERPSFSSDYPFPGLVEHIDYAVMQRVMLGQRPNMGAIMEDPNYSQLNQQWIAAALALGAQFSTSFSLPDMGPDALRAYRSLLVHYDPFKGETRVSSLLRPEVFVTRREGISFLGILNRSAEQKEYSVQLSDYGLDSTLTYLSYDVDEDAFRPVTQTVRAVVPGNTFRLVVLRHTPGVVWTDSSFEVLQEAGGGLTLQVRGPAGSPGSITLYVPKAKAVYLDGQKLSRTRRSNLQPGTFSYNTAIGILRMKYDHETPHEIRVEVD